MYAVRIRFKKTPRYADLWQFLAMRIVPELSETAETALSTPLLLPFTRYTSGPLRTPPPSGPWIPAESPRHGADCQTVNLRDVYGKWIREIPQKRILRPPLMPRHVKRIYALSAVFQQRLIQIPLPPVFCLLHSRSPFCFLCPRVSPAPVTFYHKTCKGKSGKQDFRDNPRRRIYNEESIRIGKEPAPCGRLNLKWNGRAWFSPARK